MKDQHGVVTEPGTLRFERMLPGPIERVWSYLVDPDRRATWLAAGPMDLRVGGRVQLVFHNDALTPDDDPPPPKYANMGGEVSFEGRVVACDPPRLLTFTWAEEHAPHSEVTFELTPDGDRVRLVLTHRRLDTRDLLISVAAGWHTHLDILVARLSHRASAAFWRTHTRLESDYAKRGQSSHFNISDPHLPPGV